MGGPHDVVARASSWWVRRHVERALTDGAGAPVLVRRDAVGGREWVCRRPRGGGGPGAPTLVMVHGLGTSGSSLVRLMGHLAPRADTWAPDLPGFGATPGPDRALDLAELADALVAWMDVVGIERAAMLGHSLGCQVVGHVATRHPARLSRAVLVGPTLDPAARSLVRQAGRLALDGPREPAAELPWVAADYLRCGPSRMLRTLRDALAPDVEERLPRMDLPVLLVRGRADPVAPQPWLEHAADLLPDARVVVVPGAHAVNYSHPAELADVIVPFLDDVG